MVSTNVGVGINIYFGIWLYFFMTNEISSAYSENWFKHHSAQVISKLSLGPIISRPARGPFHKRFFHRNLNLMEISFCSRPYCGKVIAMKNRSWTGHQSNNWCLLNFIKHLATAEWICIGNHCNISFASSSYTNTHTHTDTHIYI